MDRFEISKDKVLGPFKPGKNCKGHISEIIKFLNPAIQYGVILNRFDRSVIFLYNLKKRKVFKK
jgi:hypothetical protein